MVVEFDDLIEGFALEPSASLPSRHHDHYLAHEKLSDQLARVQSTPLPDDPYVPRSWSKVKKWRITLILSTLVLCLSYGPG